MANILTPKEALAAETMLAAFIVAAIEPHGELNLCHRDQADIVISLGRTGHFYVRAKRGGFAHTVERFATLAEFRSRYARELDGAKLFA